MQIFLNKIRFAIFFISFLKQNKLLIADTSELKEPEKVRASQEKALQSLQAYTLSHYPDSPAKFGELLLRIPELQRTCSVNTYIVLKLILIITSTNFFFHCFSSTGWQRISNNKIKRR